MKMRSLMFRGAAAAACTGLVATMWACSGDDNSGVGGDGGGSTSSSDANSSGDARSNGDANSSGDTNANSDANSSGDATVNSDASSSSSGSGSSSSGGQDSSGSSGSGSSGGSSGSADGGHDGGGSSSSGAGSSSGSSGADGGTDGAHEAASDATIADAAVDSNASTTATDASDAATANAGRIQLAWCPWLDFTFGIGPDPDAGADAGICATETPTGGTCADRTGMMGWASNATGIAGGFLDSVGNDCRVNAIGGPPVLNATDVSDYQSQLTAWTLAFFGCPEPGADLGPFGGFGLIPKPLSGHTFTTADAQLLEDLFVASINQSLSDNGASMLTVDQTTQVQASLASWATGLGPTVSSAYSYADPTSCALDGGAVNDMSADGASE